MTNREPALELIAFSPSLNVVHPDIDRHDVHEPAPLNQSDAQRLFKEASNAHLAYQHDSAAGRPMFEETPIGVLADKVGKNDFDPNMGEER